MSAKRITRRQALTTGMAAVVAGCANPSGEPNSAPIPKTDPNASWIGKTVMSKKFGLQGIHTPPPNPKAPEDPETPPVEVSVALDSASYDVKGEKDARVEVLEATGKACWVEKDQFVQLPDAVDFFTKLLADNPKNTFALTSRGWAHYLLGEPAKAIEDFDEFLKLTPVNAAIGPGTPQRWEGLVNRGLVYAEEGELEKALADLDAAIKDWPTLAIAFVNRGYTHELMGKYAEAVADYDRAVAVCPTFTLAWNNRAWLLATCPDEKIRNGPTAELLATTVCFATGNREAMYLDTLAAAYAEIGMFANAVKTQEKALEDKAYVARYGEGGQKRLQLYKDKKPFRTDPVKK